MARTFMLHSYLNWTDHLVDNIYLWSFNVKHIVWLHNHLPNYCSGITQLEFLTSNNVEHIDLRISHVWVCPVFVMDPKLKNDQKIPKWNRRFLLGHFIGFL